jgi:hypothetical protein
MTLYVFILLFLCVQSTNFDVSNGTGTWKSSFNQRELNFFNFICFFSTSSGSTNNYIFSSGVFTENTEFNISLTTEVLIGNGITSTTLNLVVPDSFIIYLNYYDAVIKISNLSIQYGGNNNSYYPTNGVFRTDSPANNSKIYLNNLKVQNLGLSLCFIFIVFFFFLS